MKKFFIILGLFLAASPVFAACSINGDACSVSLSNWDTKPLQEQLIPNNLLDMQRPNAFQPKYFKPYHDALINTKQETHDYNSNCQFGVCLPGQNTGGGPDNFD